MHGNTKLKFIDAKQAKDFFKYKNTNRKLETYYKWNIYLLAASSWCSYLSLYDARKHKTEVYIIISILHRQTNITFEIHKSFRSYIYIYLFILLFCTVLICHMFFKIQLNTLRLHTTFLF